MSKFGGLSYSYYGYYQYKYNYHYGYAPDDRDSPEQDSKEACDGREKLDRFLA
jgi:hypothetical protein